MMISKFNNLIRSRVLWITILVIIIFSFVIWGTIWPSQLGDDPRSNAAGKLNGEEVLNEEFWVVYRATYLSFAINNMDRNVASDDLNELIQRMTWLRLASLREAAQMGLSATDVEVATAIRNSFVNPETRVFDRQYYEMFLQNIVARLGYTERQFESMIRQEVTLQKLAAIIGRQARITPLEIQRTFETLMDVFEVDYVKLSREAAEQSVAVAEEDAEALYQEDPERFTLPEQRDILYVTLPIAGFMTEREFDEATLMDYYELHMDDFTSEETDENGDVREIVKDFSEAREDIVAGLLLDVAREQAESAAMDFYLTVIPDSEGRVPDFAEAAAAAGLDVQEANGFSRFEVPVEDGGTAFVTSAYELTFDAYDRISPPFMGRADVYIQYLDAVHEPRVPAFDEVKDTVLEAARQKAIEDSMRSRAEELKQAAEAGLADGKTFADSLKAFDVEIQSPEPFTSMTAAAGQDPATSALLQGVVSCNAGEVAEPVATFEGDLVVAYVKTRTPAEPAAYAAYSGEIANTIRRRRAEEQFIEWQAALLDPAHFTDYRQVDETDDEFELSYEDE